MPSNSFINAGIGYRPLISAFECHNDSRSFLNRLTSLFSEMDQAYEVYCQSTGFKCQGCADNCCQTLFYHHTLMEFLYIRNGYLALSPNCQADIKQRARAYCCQLEKAKRRAGPLRHMCPVNDAGLCRLYDFRPMICRLHGIPHSTSRADGKFVTGPGCEEFLPGISHAGILPLDRTPYYMQMAALEKELRNLLEFRAKFKMTMAEMIIAFT
ncbi:MAG: hypothetical protein QNI92_11235 [Desulfobacterales bacterium]|nr:hypothetical protein [Desulfobacterales bacterium]